MTIQNAPANSGVAGRRPLGRRPAPVSGELTARDAEIVARWTRGQSLRTIGRAVGLSGEGVRRVLLRIGLNPALSRVVKRATRMESERRADERYGRAHRCAVCAGPMRRGRRRTCSADCATAWPALRVHTPEGRERHRRAVAKSILRHPGGKSLAAVEWATKYLMDPDGTPPNRTFFVPGSLADQMAKRLGFREVSVETQSLEKEKE